MQFSVPESTEDNILHYNKDGVFWYIPASRRACQAREGADHREQC